MSKANQKLSEKDVFCEGFTDGILSTFVFPAPLAFEAYEKFKERKDDSDELEREVETEGNE